MRIPVRPRLKEPRKPRKPYEPSESELLENFKFRQEMAQIFQDIAELEKRNSVILTLKCGKCGRVITITTATYLLIKSFKCKNHGEFTLVSKLPPMGPKIVLGGQFLQPEDVRKLDIMIDNTRKRAIKNIKSRILTDSDP